MNTLVNKNQQIEELRCQLNQIIKAYQLLEEYAMELTNEETETISECNKIVQNTLNRL